MELQKAISGLEPHIKKVAALIKQHATQQLRIRFHDDTDGIASALIIHRAASELGIRSAAQRSESIFTLEDAAVECSTKAAGAPLLLLLDCGAQRESEPALRVLRSEGFSLAIIDHHPPTLNLKLLDAFLSPYLLGDSAALSNITTGALCGEVARALVGERSEWRELVAVSLCGDRSTLFDSLPQEEKKLAALRATAIDYLATCEKGAPLEAFDGLLANQQEAKRLASEAQRALQHALSKIKIRQHAIGALTVQIAKVRRGPLPSKGRVANTLQEHAPVNKPTIIIVYGGDKISLRTNSAALALGIDLNKAIALLAKRAPHALVGGGGHAVAASCLVQPRFAPSVVKTLLKIFEEQSTKGA